ADWGSHSAFFRKAARAITCNRFGGVGHCRSHALYISAASKDQPRENFSISKNPSHPTRLRGQTENDYSNLRCIENLRPLPRACDSSFTVISSSRREGADVMFSVIFEVHPKPEERDNYFETAKMLRPELEKVEGFGDNIRYRSLTREGWILSLSSWRDE